ARATLGGVERVRRIRFAPLHIARRAIDRGHMLPRETKPRLHLRAMMARVQHTSPKDPDALPRQPAKERPTLKPPRRRPSGQLPQSPAQEPDVLVDVRLNDRVLARGQEFLDNRFLGADELGEESSFGQELMHEDGANRIGLLMRLEVEETIRRRA